MTWTLNKRGPMNWPFMTPAERSEVMHQYPEYSDSDVKSGEWIRDPPPFVEPTAHETVDEAPQVDAWDSVASPAAEEIAGPLGPFLIPSSPQNTRDHVLELTQQVFAGEYFHPELPKDIEDIVDVGSGWGAFAVWAKAKWPEASLECYEPHDAAADLCEANVAPFATLHRVAVTSEPKPLFAAAWDWGSARLNQDGKPVAALHPENLPPCDLLKLDCEGSEADILAAYAGSTEEDENLLAGCRAVLVEWHSPELKLRCDAILKAKTKLRCVQAAPVERGYGVSIWTR